MDFLPFVLFSVEGHLDGFQFGAIMIKMINVCYSVSCEHKFLLNLTVYLRGILLGYIASIYLT